MKSKLVLQVVMSSLVATLATAAIVAATTTIGANISTGGTLTVTGATALNGNTTLGNAATDVNLFTGTLQASTTALFTGATTFYNTVTISGANGLVLGSSAPTGSAGMIYYDTTNAVIKLHDGSNWFTVGTTTSGISLSGNRLQLADLTTQYMTIGTTTQQGFSMLTVEATSTTAIPLTLVARASQTANLLQVLNVGGTELFAIDANGNASTSAMTIGGALYVTGDTSLVTASSTGTVKFSTINSDTGTVDFSDDHLTTTGNITFAVGSSTSSIKSSSITSDTGSIDFSDENLTTTGTLIVDQFTQGGACWATSTTATSHTVTEQNMLDYNCFEVTWNTGNGTWTLPATSTMTTLLATAGDMREWIIHNATTTAATTFTIAAGTGIDLIGVTTADAVIDGTEYSRLTCIRQTDTDVACIVSELLHVD